MTDDEAVARFEQLYRDQEEAPTWTPVTPYDLASRRAVEGRHPDVIREVFGHGPMLDYGCGPDAILVRLLRERQVRVDGYDPQLRDEWRNLRWQRGVSYRVLICREVLEHCMIREIRRLLREWRDVFRPRFLYITTRFAKAPDHLLAVETEFDVDPTHITCLTKPLLRLLCVLEGYASRPDLEARLDWQGKGRCLVMERL